MARKKEGLRGRPQHPGGSLELSCVFLVATCSEGLLGGREGCSLRDLASLGLTSALPNKLTWLSCCLPRAPQRTVCDCPLLPVPRFSSAALATGHHPSDNNSCLSLSNIAGCIPFQ